jgi:hypothetical protein
VPALPCLVTEWANFSKSVQHSSLNFPNILRICGEFSNGDHPGRVLLTRQSQLDIKKNRLVSLLLLYQHIIINFIIINVTLFNFLKNDSYVYKVCFIAGETVSFCIFYSSFDVFSHILCQLVQDFNTLTLLFSIILGLPGTIHSIS